MRTFQSFCDAYIALVYPGQTLPPDQLRKVRRAFYAGAEGMWKLLDDIAGNDSIGEDAAMAILTGLREELRAFAGQVMRGQA